MMRRIIKIQKYLPSVGHCHQRSIGNQKKNLKMKIRFDSNPQNSHTESMRVYQERCLFIEPLSTLDIIKPVSIEFRKI
jgi:hypothetical protein